MINFALLLTSLFAGMLTVIAPCVLPLLPVIIGSSWLDERVWRPVVISLSLGISIIVFTLLLKVFTLFINVPAQFWSILSGGILILFGLTLLFPRAWDWLSFKLRLSSKSEQFMDKAARQHSISSTILLGAALGPVFSSCSPTYFVILATVLPVNLLDGVIYLSVYAFGLMIMLCLLAGLGRVLINRLRFVANPYGWFKRFLGIILFLIGLAVILQFDKTIENDLVTHGFGSTKIERKLLSHINVQNNNINNNSTTTTAWNDSNAGTFGDFGPAPELIGLTGWINSSPLTLMQLRGKVVLLDFWTYSCINCIRTLPYLESWYQQYHSQGLVIIGLSDPEFQFEKNRDNVLAAVRKNNLTYPIALDNNHATWNAYHNLYWPAKYLIDRQGHLRYYHFGEGEYEQTEHYIQKLLNIQENLVSSTINAPHAGNELLTPEIYLGKYRRDTLVAWGSSLSPGEWTINQYWDDSDQEYIHTTHPGAILILNFYASTANLVLDGHGRATVYVDNQLLTNSAGTDVKNGHLVINGARLYQLTNFNNNYAEHVIKIVFNNSGINAYSWTFG